MTGGRKNAKRLAEHQDRLLGEQEKILAKEERQKGAMQKDIESQRIATMRSRFGGQAAGTAENTQSETDTASGGTPAISNSAIEKKYKTPNRLTSRDPMRSTLFNMRLDEGDSQAGEMQ